jgi:methyl-accepting chemotaxis protein
MNPISPRILLALLAPVGVALALVSVDATHNLPATVMAVAALSAVWFAATGNPPTNTVALADAIAEVASGKAPRAVPDAASTELRELWQALNLIHAQGQKAREDLQEAKSALETRPAGSELDDETREQLASVGNELKQALLKLTESADGQQRHGEQASKHTRELASALSGVAEQAETLAGSADEGSSAILQMTATNDQMAENIGELGASVRESVASIEEMTFSIKEVAKNVDALSLTAEETSSSMNEMDVSIDQVQSNANETARLSEEVARDAEMGAEAILKTIGEIYRIKESSQEAVSVISNLGSRIDAIGQILNVIDDVAEQTNLLALNAAIIAAQAGEHGKGFAVVADEIKDLAERAGASTKEIADLIKTIQSESRNAIQAVERGAQNVDRGVQVSNDAERALKKILESSQKSTNMVRAIARATVEQAKGSRQVTDSIGRIAETVQQIAAATAEQARGSELIMTSGEKMRTIAQQVERSSQEQSRGGRQITHAIEHISNMVQQLNQAQKQRRQDTERALLATEELLTAARAQSSSLAQLGHALSALNSVLEDRPSAA